MKIQLNLLLALIMTTILSFAVYAQTEGLPVYRGVGGDFKLESTLGRQVTLSEFSDKLVLLTFGYTNCSDVCPITLSFLNKSLAKLGDAAKNVQVLFVSVDPDYDSLTHLQKYLSYFNQDFVGLTGSKVAIDKVVSLYNIRYSQTSALQISTQYRKKRIVKDDSHHASHLRQGTASAQQDTSSLFSHSTYIYLIDHQGRVRAIFDTTTPAEEVAHAVRQIIES